MERQAAVSAPHADPATRDLPGVDLPGVGLPGVGWRREHPLVWVLIAVCLGLLLDRQLPERGWAVGAPLWWSASAAGLVAWFLARRGGSTSLAAGFLFASLVAMGAARHHAAWYVFPPDELGQFAGERPAPVCLEAFAVGTPRRLPAPPPDPLWPGAPRQRSQLELEVRAIRDRATWCPASGRSMLTVDGRLPGIRAGDRLRVFAWLSASSPPRNPGEFPFHRHARGNGQRSRLRASFPECVSVVGRRPGQRFLRGLDRVRTGGRRLLWGHLEQPQSGLAAAVLLGDREQVGAARREAFVTTGTVHLLVVSGLHMGILASGLFAAFRLGLLPRRRALLLVALLVVFYALVTDARPPIVRATVLVVVVCVGQALGRPTLAFNSLAAAGLVVLALNPADLFRTGPQLSFLAVAALAWFGSHRRTISRWRLPDPLDELIAETRPWGVRVMRWGGRWIWELTLASAVVWLVVQPLVMARFHLFTPIAIVLSPLTWVPIAVSLLAGFVVLVLGWWIPPIAVLFGWLCDVSLRLLERCVQYGQQVPGGHFWVAGPAEWWLIGFYGLLAVLVALPRAGPRRRYVAWSVLAVWVVVGSVPWWQRPESAREVRCTFLAVGHGCAVVVELPGGKKLLYDSGSLGSPSFGARLVSNYLWTRGITELDAVVVSHSDIDHYNALPELIERFDVGQVIVSPLMFREPAAAPDRLRRAIDEAGIPIRTVWAGQRLPLDPNVQLDVLHPPREGTGGSDNANSIVLCLTHGGKRLLLTGDLESPGTEVLLAQDPVDCEVLMAPHHGSPHSDPEAVCDWSRPAWVVISSGMGNPLEASRRVYERTGARVLCTATAGAVTVRMTGEGMGIETFLSAGGGDVPGH